MPLRKLQSDRSIGGVALFGMKAAHQPRKEVIRLLYFPMTPSQRGAVQHRGA